MTRLTYRVYNCVIYRTVKIKDGIHTLSYSFLKKSFRSDNPTPFLNKNFRSDNLLQTPDHTCTSIKGGLRPGVHPFGFCIVYPIQQYREVQSNQE